MLFPPDFSSPIEENTTEGDSYKKRGEAACETGQATDQEEDTDDKLPDSGLPGGFIVTLLFAFWTVGVSDSFSTNAVTNT